jgi:hypothetical protein
LQVHSVAAVPRNEWSTRRVLDAMIPRDQVPLLDEGDEAFDALAELSASQLNRSLVVDDGRLAGLLSITNLARALEVARSPRPVRGAAPERAQ